VSTKPDILFSVHEYDRDGDISDPGIFLHFGNTKIKAADDLAGLRRVIEHLNGMVQEIEDNYPEFQQ
jgi:hypothetical protein